MAATGQEPVIRSITLSPHLAEVARGRAMIADVASQAGFSEERVFDITVACSEAMANAIEHSPVKGEVQVRTVLRPDRLEVEVQGPGEFQAPDRLKKRESRGLGLPLMAKLSDHLALFSGPAGETFVSLTFYLPGRQPKDQDAVPPSFRNLSEEDHLLDDVLSHLPDGFYVLDADWRLIYVNPTMLARLGRQPTELLGATIWDAFPALDPSARIAFDAVKKSGESTRVTVRGSTGSWLELSVFPVPEGIAVFSRDITEQKRAGDAVAESEERVRRKLESLLSPEGAVEGLDLKDIIDAPGIQSLLDDFYRLAGIPLAIIDLQGRVLVGAGWADICTQFHRVNPETCRNCIESDTVLTTGVPEGEFKLYKCENHMWDVATPIMVGGEHMGNIFSGQFFFENEVIDRDLFRAQAKRYGFDEEAYLAALDAVPRLSRDSLGTGMSFFVKLARLLSDEGYARIKLARVLAQREVFTESLRQAHEELQQLQRNYKQVPRSLRLRRRSCSARTRSWSRRLSDLLRGKSVPGSRRFHGFSQPGEAHGLRPAVPDGHRVHLGRSLKRPGVESAPREQGDFVRCVG